MIISKAHDPEALYVDILDALRARGHREAPANEEEALWLLTCLLRDEGHLLVMRNSVLCTIHLH